MNLIIGKSGIFSQILSIAIFEALHTNILSGVFSIKTLKSSDTVLVLPVPGGP